MKEIVTSYRRVRKSRRQDKAKVQKLMVNIRKEMLKRGMNLFRVSEDEINEQFMQWNSKAEVYLQSESMKIPNDVWSLFQ